MVGADGRSSVVVAVIDIVASRSYPDQTALLAGVADMVERTLVDEGDARSAGGTVGDEFQAVWSGDALPAAIVDLARLRLALATEPPVTAGAPDPGRGVDVRVGVGVGAITGDAHDATAAGQSGPAWWDARAALDHATSRRNAWPSLRWWVAGEGLDAQRACLVAMDTLWWRFDHADRVAARRLLEGATAAAIARGLGIGQPSLSSRLHDHGVYGWVRTLETLSS